MYNIHDYILETKKGFLIMTVDHVMQRIKGSKEFDLLPSKHRSINKIEEEPFYISTQLIDININLNSRFILISAPGATGKSVLAKHIAFQRKAIYWNLADINIGDGTFQGTLYKALGVTNISAYAQALQNGETTLVIDAFDEAELISGRKRIETFIKEANDFLENAIVPSIILLSRTETAQNIAIQFKTNNIPYSHYEIGFFSETQAKDFVIKIVEKRRDITPAVHESINQYFEKISQSFQDKSAREHFLGYAPVLEAISAHIAEIENTSKLLNDLQEDNSEVALVGQIMNNLLEREQEKLINSFKNKLGEEAKKINNWETIYGSEEQMVRLLNYILFDEIAYNDYSLVNIPTDFIDDYIHAIQSFLPQHPFIQKTNQDISETVLDFTGPAFRDYSLASIMLNVNFEESAELYYQRENSTTRFPSQLFWEHYIKKSDNKIQSQHFSYVMEAFRAKTSIGQQTHLDLIQDNDESYATFRIINGKNTISTTTLDVIKEKDFCFDNINNCSIYIQDDILIGQNDNANITDSTIFCNKLIINAKHLSLCSFSPCDTIICCSGGMEATNNSSINVTCSGDGEFHLDVPNIFNFPKLVKYKESLSTTEKLDIYSFVHNLRRIFSNFRTHKKDMPARDAEKIDFVIIGDNEIRQNIFKFLIEKNIIFREEHLYKINLNNMSDYDISWGALVSTDTQQLQKTYISFLEWSDTNIPN